MAQFPLSYYLVIRDSMLREMGLIRPVKAKSDAPFEVEVTGDPNAWSDLK